MFPDVILEFVVVAAGGIVAAAAAAGIVVYSLLFVCFQLLPSGSV